MRAPVASLDSRRIVWSSFASLAARCDACGIFASGRCISQAVEGEGNPNADIALVGEALGADEDHAARNFIGRAGELLTACINAVGLVRSELWICNSTRCRPTTLLVKNRKPTHKEIDSCRGYLVDELARVKPKVIVALGDTAATSLLGRLLGGVTDNRGKVRWLDEFNAWVVVTFHPAYALRLPGMAEFIKDDLRLAQRVLAEGGPRVVEKTCVESVTDLDRLREVRDEILNHPSGKLAVDTETNGVHPITSRAFIYSLSQRARHAYVVPRFLSGWSPLWGRALKEADAILLEIMRSDLRKIGFHIAFDDVMTWSTLGHRMRNVYFCGMIAHHLLNAHLGERAHSLKICCNRYTDMGRYDDPLDQWLIDHGHTIDGKPDMSKIWLAPDSLVHFYAGCDADGSLRLEEVFVPQLHASGLWHVFEHERMPLCIEHAETDREGLRIDVEHLDRISGEIDSALDTLQQQLNDVAGPDVLTRFKGNTINPNSHTQVGKLLFEHLDLPVLARTDTGQPATGEEYLLPFRQASPAVDLILKSRTFSKIRGTWLGDVEERGRKTALRAALDEDGRARMSTRIAGPETLRFATRRPFPVHTFPKPEPGMPRVRALIIPNDGFVFVSRDFKQQELALQMILAGQEDMVEAIVDQDQDAHERVTQDLGGVAKATYLVNVNALDTVDIGGGHFMTIVEAVKRGAPLPLAIARDVPPNVYERDGLLWLSEDAYTIYKKHRTTWKSVQFMILFRGGPSKLARMALGCRCVGDPRVDPATGELCEHYGVAQHYIQRYYERYEHVKWFQYHICKELQRTGIVREVFGSWRQLPGALSSDKYTVLEAERAGCNFPIQRAGNALLVRAYLGIKREFRGKPPLKASFPGRVAFTVHDEIISEIREDLVGEGNYIVQKWMERPHKELGGRSLRTDGGTPVRCWGG